MIFLWLACAPEQQPEVVQGTISLLSYNIHGLPAEVTGDDTEARIHEIAPRIPNFDIVGLQEDWIDSHHQILREYNQNLVVDRFDEPFDDEKVYGAGLSYFGVHPVINVEHVYYDSCNGLVSNGSDCFASKGVQHLALEISGVFVLHVLNTHLEAGGGEADHDIRAQQINTILSLVQGIEEAPVVVMGDFNLRPSDPQEEELLILLREDGALRQTCMEVSCDETDHIDQIFIRSGREVELTVDRWEREASFVDSQGLPLSDHPAIASQLIWER